MKTCPYCAEAIQDAAWVCRYCQRPYPTQTNTAAQARNRGRLLLFVVVIAMLAVLMIGAIGIVAELAVR